MGVPSKMSEKSSLWIRFDDQSESYTLGFEAGAIFQRMNQENLIETLIHAKNLNQIQQMATKLGFTCYDSMVELLGEYDEWLNVKLEKSLHRVK
jgi:hypothetical protein